ncbi:MAG: HD domain-containing protein [Candidatus Shapirobacteria bacterium]|nr:HD domain-containing protein [Candidatus Shapirobacteria bacterium]
MKINDKIYGDIEIKSKVIIDLINTPAFQRLKKISQDGAPHYIQPVRNVSRYEHSIGVWYLSFLYKRPIEEQIACLLHDLSHTAFSHVIDFVVKNEKYEFADSKLKEIINKSDIPQIIKNGGYNLEKILDKTNFPLLNNYLPNVSVDRWDYFMRDGFAIGFLPKSLIDTFLNEIFEKEDVFYFKDIRLASTFAILFLSFSRLIWLDPTAHGAFFLMAEAIKIALEDKLITEEDFFTDDEVLFAKLKSSPNTKIQQLLNRLCPGNEFIYEDESKAEFFGQNKPRFVDPLVENYGKLIRVSELTPSLKYYFEEFSQKYKKTGVCQLKR